MKIFHFPKHIFFLFFVLVFTAFFSLGVAGYFWSIKTENVYYLEGKSIIGDYVVSPSDTIGRNGGDPYGIVPVRSSTYIENAEGICNDLNSLSGVKSLAVACVDSYFTFVVKGNLKTKNAWFNGKSVNNISSRLQSDGSTYISLRNTQATPFNNDSVYGVDSDALLDYYKDNEGFEFYGLTGKKGVFLSESIKNDLGIDETDEEVTLLVSYRGRSAFDGGIISVPIAGFFRAQEKTYEKEIREGESISRLRADDPAFMFLDMEYFTSVYKTLQTIFPESEEYDDLLSSLKAKKGMVLTTMLPVSYQNIWIKGGSEDSLVDVINKTGQPLSVESTFKISLSLDRFYSFMNSIHTEARYLFLLVFVAIGFMGCSVVRRILDYEEKTTLLMYASGSRKKSIVLGLYLPVAIPSILIGFAGLYAGALVLHRELRGDHIFYVTVDRVIKSNALPFSIVMIVYLVIVLLSVCSFVNSHTSFESPKRRRK